MEYQTLSKDIVDASFNIFVDKYIEFCNSKIFPLTDETSPEFTGNGDSFKQLFVEQKIVVEPPTGHENCLDELDDVGDIIDKLFNSEKNFIEQMNLDIAEFNKLYNCYKYGNLDDPGLKSEELKKISVVPAVATPAAAVPAAAVPGPDSGGRLGRK